MPTWVPIVVSIVIGVLIVLVNAVINTTIKFAPDAATAIQDLKRLGRRSLRKLLEAAIVVWLIYNTLAPGPVTLGRVFAISSAVGALFYSLSASLMMEILGVVWKAVEVFWTADKDLQRALLGTQRVVERLVDNVETGR